MSKKVTVLYAFALSSALALPVFAATTTTTVTTTVTTLPVVIAVKAPVAAKVITMEAPDTLVIRLGERIIALINDPATKTQTREALLEKITNEVSPYIDFSKMTALSVGKSWREASLEQKTVLTAEFKKLLVHSYAKGVEAAKDKKLVVKPLRVMDNDEAQVNSSITGGRGDPVELNYRLYKDGAQWKIYDVDILGAWIVSSYKNTFADTIEKKGVAGLITTLQEKNKKLEAAAR